MENSRKKLENFWFYYKKHLLVALAVLACLAWFSFQNVGKKAPDYHVGLVQPEPCREETLQKLEARLTAQGADCNGDGTVVVQIHTYFVDLADDSPNAGVQNAQTAAALDADLVGGVSGIFLVEDLSTFRSLTNDLLADSSLSFGDWQLVLRKDAGERYQTLADNLS